MSLFLKLHCILFFLFVLYFQFLLLLVDVYKRQTVAWGVKRGVYSNEAGQGTGPQASSAAEVNHPAVQGFVQAFSVYVDTLFVCSATGFMILMTNCYTTFNETTKQVVYNAGPVSYTHLSSYFYEFT